MKKLLIITGLSLILVMVVTLTSLRIFGFEPEDMRPGMWLSGELVTEPVSDWSFSDQFGEIFVQTRSWWLLPHSVTVFCTVYNGDLYLFSAYYQGGDFPDTRLWNRNVMRDPLVRLKIGERLYDRRVSYITGDADKAPVLQSFINKYPRWNSPGINNVHIFLVEPTG